MVQLDIILVFPDSSESFYIPVSLPVDRSHFQRSVTLLELIFRHIEEAELDGRGLIYYSVPAYIGVEVSVESELEVHGGLSGLFLHSRCITGITCYVGSFRAKHLCRSHAVVCQSSTSHLFFFLLIIARKLT